MTAKDCQEQQFKNIIFNIEKAIKKEVEEGSSDCIYYKDMYRFYSRRDEILEYFKKKGFRISCDLNTSEVTFSW